ncbi:hypothetical protein RJ640_020967 [Escallonia rubra]|uniref:Uncharacterized protein n=1 Tax=Escallonia rubra TaxID=112253 RepID=A0AA88RRE7_9ASTE|nr:hypothetical protein RJ640_020967 [Escallonia rubra]
MFGREARCENLYIYPPLYSAQSPKMQTKLVSGSGDSAEFVIELLIWKDNEKLMYVKDKVAAVGKLIRFIGDLVSALLQGLIKLRSYGAEVTHAILPGKARTTFNKRNHFEMKPVELVQRYQIAQLNNNVSVYISFSAGFCNKQRITTNGKSKRITSKTKKSPYHLNRLCLLVIMFFVWEGGGAAAAAAAATAPGDSLSLLKYKNKTLVDPNYATYHPATNSSYNESYRSVEELCTQYTIPRCITKKG